MSLKKRQATNKHAYLITCHNNFSVLKNLLCSLDDERNDIYIHIDKKVKNFPFDEMRESVSKATVIFTDRVTENWGGYSQVKAELILLKKATQELHTYYHLISGADFPLKSQDYIHNFFKLNQGKEFIRFDKTKSCREQHIDRIKYYRFFQDKIGRNRGKIVALYSMLEYVSLSLQKKLVWIEQKA